MKTVDDLTSEYNALEEKRAGIVMAMNKVTRCIGDLISPFKVDDRITWGKLRLRTGRVFKIYVDMYYGPTVSNWEVAEALKNGKTRLVQVHSFDSPKKEGENT